MPVLHAVVEHPHARFLRASLVAYAHYCMLSRPTKQAFLRRHPPTARIAERRIYREQIPREDNLTGNRTAVGAPESRHGLHPCRRRVLFRRHLFQHILSHICIGVRLRKSLAQQRLIQCYAGQDRLCQRFHLLCGLVSLSPGQQSSSFSCLSNNAFPRSVPNSSSRNALICLCRFVFCIAAAPPFLTKFRNTLRIICRHMAAFVLGNVTRIQLAGRCGCGDHADTLSHLHLLCSGSAASAANSHLQCHYYIIKEAALAAQAILTSNFYYNTIGRRFYNCPAIHHHRLRHHDFFNFLIIDRPGIHEPHRCSVYLPRDDHLFVRSAVFSQ